MSEEKNLALFNIFAGREVGTKVKTSSGDGNSVIVEIVPDPADSVIAEMEKTAKDEELSLFIEIFPPANAKREIVNTSFNSKRATATIVLGKRSYIRDVKIG